MSENTEAKKPAAGWYPDPHAKGTRRFWDGKKWTDNRSESTQSTPLGEPSSVLTYVFILGAVLLVVGATLLYAEFPRVDTSSSDALFSTSGNAKAALVGAVLMYLATLVLLVPIVGWGVKYGTRAAHGD